MGQILDDDDDYTTTSTIYNTVETQVNKEPQKDTSIFAQIVNDVGGGGDDDNILKELIDFSKHEKLYVTDNQSNQAN
jgi:hypothetical protein